MRALLKVVLAGLVQLGALAVLVFVPAGSLRYWQGWALLGVFALSVWLPSIYIQITNPTALQRRMRGGPAAEDRTAQKIVMAALYGSLAGMCVAGGLTHRFGWPSASLAVCFLGDLLVAAGLGLVVLVVVHNNYASTTVQVESGQTVVSTGLYGMVRHPMYSANLIMLVGLPLALGCYWGLLFAIPGVVILMARIRDEEALLRAELTGYVAYTNQVRFRLLPGVW